MKIEIWYDYVCPFCYMGNDKIQKALLQYEDAKNITIKYRTYQLYPNAVYDPNESYYSKLAKKKNITIEEARIVLSETQEAAKILGLNINYDILKHTSTFDAHRLTKYAVANGAGTEIVKLIFDAYFHGELISDTQVLVSLAKEAGLSEDKVSALLKSDQYNRENNRDVKNAKEQWYLKTIPFYAINGVDTVRESQSIEGYLDMFRRFKKD